MKLSQLFLTSFSIDDVKDIASKMIGKNLYTIQTGDVGRPCNEVGRPFYF